MVGNRPEEGERGGDTSGSEAGLDPAESGKVRAGTTEKELLLR